MSESGKTTALAELSTRLGWPEVTWAVGWARLLGLGTGLAGLGWAGLCELRLGW